MLTSCRCRYPTTQADGSGVACHDSATRNPGGSSPNNQPGSSSSPGRRSTYQVRLKPVECNSRLACWRP